MVVFQGVKAQNTDAIGTFTPYSLFGIGEIERQGTAFNRAMGGIGVGIRDNRFINYLNPASITASFFVIFHSVIRILSTRYPKITSSNASIIFTKSMTPAIALRSIP